jgi:L-rhamnose mutarotase
MPLPPPSHGPTNPSPEEGAHAAVRRFGSVVLLCPSREALYRQLHADVWPEVLSRLRRSRIRNFSIYVSQIGENRCLFSYFEYVGTDQDADFRAIDEDPATQRWWRETDPCQIPVSGSVQVDGSGSRVSPWQKMEMVFLME